MDAIDEAVARQLKLRKGGEDILPLWDQLWTAYRKHGPDGVDAFLEGLLKSGIEAE